MRQRKTLGPEAGMVAVCVSIVRRAPEDTAENDGSTSISNLRSNVNLKSLGATSKVFRMVARVCLYLIPKCLAKLQISTELYLVCRDSPKLHWTCNDRVQVLER